MPKFYVQSGNVRTVISAEDAERAALWVVHRTMQQVLPVYDEDETDQGVYGQQIVEDLAPRCNQLHPESLNLLDQERQLPMTASVSANATLLEPQSMMAADVEPACSRKPMRLGSTILLSEEGFDRPDAEEIESLKLVCQWNQLMIALERLQTML